VSAPATAAPGQAFWPRWIDDNAVGRLRQSIREGHFNHAYLLYGPSGVGKAALSQAFAQVLCCTSRDSGDPSIACGVCRSCRNVIRGTHPDVEVFSLESEARLAEKPGRIASLGIDTIRRLRASVSLLPLESPRRVMIIEDAESLPEPAQQALLKVLEEPPSSIIFLLLADEPESLLETVRSRCESVQLRPISKAAIENMLSETGVEASLASEIAALSHGLPSWAVSAVTDAKTLQTRRDERDSARAWLSSSPYDRLVAAYKLGGQYSKRRSEIVRNIQSVISVLREEMYRLTSPEQASSNYSALPLAQNVTAHHVARALAASLRCLDDLERNVRPRLALEAMVLAWPNLQSQPT
jgi:DNA polymerase III delta' subunit